MKKTFFLLFIIISGISLVFAWGFEGHRKINRMAVFTLPPSMIGFYKKHIDYLTDKAVRPDKRRKFEKEEAPRHYIDMEYYPGSVSEKRPLTWDEAAQHYSEDSIKTHGIVPWH